MALRRRIAPPPGTVDAVLEPGDRVVQIGGGLGSLSVIAARVPPGVSVLVLDPRPRTAAALRQFHAVHGRVEARVRCARVRADAAEALETDVVLGEVLEAERPTLLVVDDPAVGPLLAALEPGPTLDRVLAMFGPRGEREPGCRSTAGRLAARGFAIEADPGRRPAVLFRRAHQAKEA